MALSVALAVWKVKIMKAVCWPLKWHSIGFIQCASKTELVGMLLVVLTSKEDLLDQWNPIGTFSITHECSLSLISDIVLNPCMNTVCTPPLLNHSADSGESMLKMMSPFVRVLALMNF